MRSFFLILNSKLDPLLESYLLARHHRIKFNKAKKKMCSEKKILVGLMASLLFSVSILNYSKLSKLEEKKMDENKMCCIKVDNQKNCSVNVENEVEVFIKKLNNFVYNTEILIKNELSKTILAVVNLQDKIVNVIEKKN